MLSVTYTHASHNIENLATGNFVFSSLLWPESEHSEEALDAEITQSGLFWGPRDKYIQYIKQVKTYKSIDRW